MKVIAAALVFVAGVSLDYSIVRRLDMVYDGKPTVVQEGQELALPCSHAEGKSHRLKIARAKTYSFKGLGVSFEFDSSMNVQVENLRAVTTARVMYHSGSFVAVQEFHAPGGEDVLSRMETGVRAQMEAMGAKVGESKSVERVIAGEKLNGILMTAQGLFPMEHAFFWRESEGGGHMIDFCMMGKNPLGVDKAFALIVDSLKFDKSNTK
jgi:hypothetical protein